MLDMFSVPNEIIIELYKQIPEEYISFYNRIQERDKMSTNIVDKSFKEFLREVIESIKLADINLSEFRNNLVRNITRTKKSYVNEIKVETNIFEQQASELYSQYNGKKDMESCYSEVIFKWDTWAADSSKPIFSFDFIGLKPIKRQLHMFKNDLTLLLLRLLCKDYSGTLEWVVPALTTELIEFPIFGPTRTMIDLISDEEIRNEPLIIDQFYAPDDYVLRMLVKNENNPAVTRIPSLDQIDRQIISLIYSKIMPGFYSDRVIDIDVVAITEQVYSRPTLANIIEIENRIENIGKYQVEYVPKGVRAISRDYMMINFFESVTLNSNLINGKSRAQLKMGETLYKAFLKRATYKALPREQKKLNNRLAKLLLPSLQANRLKLIFDNSTNACSSLSEVIPLQFFKNRVRFSYKRDDTTVTKLKQAFDSLVKSKVILSRYTYTKATKSFTFEYLPLSREEYDIFLLQT